MKNKLKQKLIDYKKKQFDKAYGELENSVELFEAKITEGIVKELCEAIDQLDEPEVLSQEWLDNNSVYASSDGVTEEYVHVDDLQSLLVPEQELPVIPKFVAEFLIGKEDYMLYELLDDEWLYKEHDRVAKWLYDNDELTNKQREIDLVMARDRGYEVEEEQKYYIRDQHGVYLLAKNHREQGKVQTVAEIVEQYGIEEIELDYELTEQETKDYDERYLAFKVPVEELEE